MPGREAGFEEPASHGAVNAVCYFVTFEAENNLLDAARTRNHVRLVAELEEQDAIAKEVKYHRTCFTILCEQENTRTACG